MLMREIAFLVFEDFQILDASGPLAAFEIAARYRPGAYRLRVVAAEGGAVLEADAGALSRVLWRQFFTTGLLQLLDEGLHDRVACRRGLGAPSGGGPPR